MEHRIVYERAGRFAGWPANNGLWAWANDELLVGFVVGDFVEQQGHNIAEPYTHVLARSKDGGETWTDELPAPFVGHSATPARLPTPLDLTAPGLALRIVGTGYHGSDLPQGGFFVSTDYGHHWQGPYAFTGLADQPALSGLTWTPRTDYLIEGQRACLVFASARKGEDWGSEKVFCFRTDDGGLNFHFLGWLVPPTDPYRAVMPATVRCSTTKLVAALRRRQMGGDTVCWIDTFVSTDNGQTWVYQGSVTDTGPANGNPPALARLRDGRLCCVYGHRGHRRMEARFSIDEGESWSAPLILRDDFQMDRYGEADLGYPRLAQRADDTLVALYYWATAQHPRQHIAATIWAP